MVMPRDPAEQVYRDLVDAGVDPLQAAIIAQRVTSLPELAQTAQRLSGRPPGAVSAGPGLYEGVLPSGGIQRYRRQQPELGQESFPPNVQPLGTPYRPAQQPSPTDLAMDEEKLLAARLANRLALARLEGGGATGGGLTQGQALNAQVQREKMFQDALQSVMSNERGLLPYQVPEGLDFFPGYEPGGLGATLLSRLGAQYDPEVFRLRPQAMPAFEAAKRGVGL